MRFINLVILALMVKSCAPIRVNYDYEQTTKFEVYKTYQYYGGMETGLSDLDTERFLNAIDTIMKTKGFRISQNPDFFIDIKSQEYQLPQSEAIGFGLGGLAGGVSIGLPIGQAKIKRQITVDFVDENKQQLFWQAICESDYSPRDIPKNREAKLQAIAEKILAQYPPKI